MFEEFGADALQFRLYAWIAGSDRALDAIHALHLAVDRLFRAHRVEVAFPQRDVRLAAARPFEVQLVVPPTAGAEPQIGQSRPAAP